MCGPWGERSEGREEGVDALIPSRESPCWRRRGPEGVRSLAWDAGAGERRSTLAGVWTQQRFCAWSRGESAGRGGAAVAQSRALVHQLPSCSGKERPWTS